MARVLEFRDITTKWVPRPFDCAQGGSSRILRRAGTGLPPASDFAQEAHATRFRNEISSHRQNLSIGRIVPALAKNARTWHPQLRKGKEKQV